MGNLNWTEIIVAAIVLAGTLYGNWKTAQTSRDKTIEALRKENAATMQEIKDEVRGIREESQAKDEELHAGMEMLAQRTEGGFELIRKDVAQLSARVEKHNNLIERTYKLEEQTAVQAEQIKVANHRIEDLERAAK